MCLQVVEILQVEETGLLGESSLLLIELLRGLEYEFDQTKENRIQAKYG